MRLTPSRGANTKAYTHIAAMPITQAIRSARTASEPRERRGRSGPGAAAAGTSTCTSLIGTNGRGPTAVPAISVGNGGIGW